MSSSTTSNSPSTGASMKGASQLLVTPQVAVTTDKLFSGLTEKAVDSIFDALATHGNKVLAHVL